MFILFFTGNQIYCYRLSTRGKFSACSTAVSYVVSQLGNEVQLALDFAINEPYPSSDWCGFKAGIVHCTDESSYFTSDGSKLFYNMPPGVTAAVPHYFKAGKYFLHKEGHIYEYDSDSHTTSYVSKLYCS